MVSSISETLGQLIKPYVVQKYVLERLVSAFLPTNQTWSFWPHRNPVYTEGLAPIQTMYGCSRDSGGKIHRRRRTGYAAA